MMSELPITQRKWVFYRCSLRFFSTMDHVDGPIVIGLMKGAVFDDHSGDLA